MSDINIASSKVAVEADYENCSRLQRELEKSRSKSLNNLVPTSAGSEHKNATSAANDDYALANLRRHSPTPPSTRCATVSSEFSAASSIDHRSSNESCSSGCESMRRDIGAEEVLLKVVVDKRTTQQASATGDDDCDEGDNVFYINPIVSLVCNSVQFRFVRT